MSRLGLRRLARLGILSLPWMGLACSQVPLARPEPPGPMHLLPDSPVDPALTISQSETPEAATIRAAEAPADPAAARQKLPISLDTVLRLAEEQNPQIGVARSKVCAAFAEKELAAARWLPDIFVGMGYYRHEGGIQLQEGPLITSSNQAFLFGPQINAEYNPRDYAFRQIEAARKVFQNQGELSKISYEQLLDATTTYIDLLAAHAAMAIAREAEAKIKPLHEKVIRIYDMQGGTADIKIERARVEADLLQLQQAQEKLRGQIAAASAKLAYTLGLDSSVELVPVDTQMTAFHLVDASQPVDALVGQALTNGPGVRELESILCLIQSGLETARVGRFVPALRLQLGEGLFAAGPGGTLDWANRFDLGVQARWNVSDLLSAKYKKNIAMAQMNQAQWSYQELRSRLTLGVQEARSTADAMNTQFASSEELIKRSKVIVENSQRILDQPTERLKVLDSSVVQAHRALALAQLNYVDQMREYDKAQLRLLVLLGGSAAAASE